MSLRDIKRGCYSAAQYAQWRAAGEQEKQEQGARPAKRSKLPVGQGDGGLQLQAYRILEAARHQGIFSKLNCRCVWPGWGA